MLRMAILCCFTRRSIRWELRGHHFYFLAAALASPVQVLASRIERKEMNDVSGYYLMGLYFLERPFSTFRHSIIAL